MTLMWKEIVMKFMMKKLLSATVALVFVFSFFSVSALAAPPKPMPNSSILNTSVTLAPGHSWQSYQYEMASGKQEVGAAAGSGGNSTAYLVLQGASSVGGSRTTIASADIPAYSSMPENPAAEDWSPQYRYYNLVITNTGSVTCTYDISLYAD